jgi:hypothetical protein
MRGADVATPAGAFAVDSIPCFPEIELAPPCRTEALMQGALPISGIFHFFLA